MQRVLAAATMVGLLAFGACTGGVGGGGASSGDVGGSTSSSSSGAASMGASSSAGVASSGMGASSQAASGSGSGSGSGGNASSGLAGLDPTCVRLAQAYLRSFAGNLYPTLRRDAFNMGDDCAPYPLPDEDVVRMAAGDPVVAVRTLCTWVGSPVLQATQALAAGQQSGRLVYSATQADACAAAGRAYLGTRGLAGYTGMLAADGGITSMPAACAQATQGMQGDGDPCMSDIECFQGGGGARCVMRSSASCEGHCAARRSVGQTCGDAVGMADCADNLRCVDGHCMARVPDNGMCRTDAGSNLECVSGRACRSTGMCEPRVGLNASCMVLEDCQPGLFCNASGQCAARKAVGSACRMGYAGRSDCQACLMCAGAATATVGMCVARSDVGGTCVDRSCHVGLTCAGGTCVEPARTGQACVLADQPDDALQGNCLNGDEACVGTPATCQRRGLRDEACTSLPTASATRGSCDVGAATGTGSWCVRDDAAATTGVCRPTGHLGEPCGQAPFLVPQCEKSGVHGPDVGCSTSIQGEEGACVSQAAMTVGQPCSDTSNCVRGAYCEHTSDGGVGTCREGGSLGASCNDMQVWGTVCAAGRCGDGGTTTTCQPLGVVGDSCSSTVDCLPDLRCSGSGMCEARSAAGGNCGGDEDCAPGNHCASNVCLPAQCEEQGGGCAEAGYLPLLLFFGCTVWWRRRQG